MLEHKKKQKKNINANLEHNMVAYFAAISTKGPKQRDPDGLEAPPWLRKHAESIL